MLMAKKIFAIISLLLAASVYSIAETLPMGFGGVELGMSVDQVKQTLKNNPDFGYRGDKDVSLLPGENRVLIETDTSKTNPYSILDRCFFQFYEDKLYIITINVNQKKMDYISVFNTLREKYGDPNSLNPKKCEWVSDTVILNLEKPLAIKYTDKEVSESIVGKKQVQKSATEETRQRFLDGL